MLLSDEDMIGLPAEPAAAFVFLERVARARLDEILENAMSTTWDNEIEYVGAVIAVAKHYRIDIGDWEPPHVNDENAGTIFRMFKLHISGVCTELRLMNMERARQSVISIDTATKAKLRGLLDQMREEVDNQLGLTPRKRDALYSKIAALAKEVDSDWARSESLGNLAIELAEDLDEAVGTLENVRKWFGQIAVLLSRARRDQRHSQIPPPPQREPKGIEAPRTKAQGRPPPKKFDDEIPF